MQRSRIRRSFVVAGGLLLLTAALGAFLFFAGAGLSARAAVPEGMFGWIEYPNPAALPGAARISAYDPGGGAAIDCSGMAPDVRHFVDYKVTITATLTHYQQVVGCDLAMLSDSDGWAALGGPLTSGAQTRLYHWDGGGWSLIDTLSHSEQVQVRALDALASDDVWALAAQIFNNTRLYHWDGVSWDAGIAYDEPANNDLDMLSASDGWAVGDEGSIARWTGSVLVPVGSPVNTDLQAVSMLNASEGWIVGENGRMLRYDGQMWNIYNQLNNPITENLRDIVMLSSDRGYIVGDNGLILEWDGQEWLQIDSPTGAPLHSLSLPTAVGGWISGPNAVLMYQPHSPGTLGWTAASQSGFPPGDNAAEPANSNVAALESYNGRLYAGTWNENGAQVWRSSDGHTWEDFTPPWTDLTHLRDLAVFNGLLYAAGEKSGAAGEIWRTEGDASAPSPWETVLVQSTDFEADNISVSALQVFDGYLYAATGNETTGIEIWRSATGQANSWTQTNTDGFDDPAVTGTAKELVLETYNGYLYAGISRIGGTAELWYTQNGTDWDPLFTDGFGNPNASHVASMAVFDGDLYLGLLDDTDGAELLRSSNGSTFSAAFSDGNGDSNNLKPYGLVAHRERLYLVIVNADRGLQVWTSPDGTTWSTQMSGGFAYPGNTFADYFDHGAAVFQGSLYLGTGNDLFGGQVWQEVYWLALPVMHGGPPPVE